MTEQQYFYDVLIPKIHDEKLRNIAKTEVDLLPSYFWEVAASSSGKYHPQYALSIGGLARHVIAACTIALNLFTIYEYDERKQDCILIALMLHDGFKHGIEDSGMTVHEHPNLMAEYIKKKYYDETEESRSMWAIARMISCHMGQWTTSKYSSVVLNSPLFEDEKFVHMCDYLASRKDIEIKINLEEA